MALELIDTQTTDSNGEASITYTGTGAGEIEFRAKVSTLLQETYELIDAKLISDMDCYVRSGTTKTIDSTGCVITAPSSDYGMFTLSTGTTSGSRIDLPVGSVVEFDLLSYTGGITLRLDPTSGSTSIISTNSSSFGTGHWKLVNEGTSLKAYLDGVVVATVNNVDSVARRCSFRVDANSTMKINNLFYY